MSTDGQRIKWRRNIAENFNRLQSRVHERYRQTTDGRAIAYSEREREFTFANNVNALKAFISLFFLCLLLQIGLSVAVALV